MAVTMIAAVARNGVIGAGDRLPWRLPADLAYFKRQTLGKTVVMGARTFRSLGRPLPGRHNVVLSRRMAEAPEGCDLVRSVEEALQRYGDRELMVIGGAEVYRQFLPHADRLLLTEIDAEAEGDVFFPPYDRSEWKLVSRTPGLVDEKNTLPHAFCVYERIRK
jgi:dihydrofolate reductase